jgi:two-component sensor histidine kinase
MRGVLERVGGNILSATRRVEHERTLLRSTVEAMPIGVVILAPDGTVLLVNQQAMDFWANDKLEGFKDFTKVKRLKLDGTPYPVTDWPLARALRTGEITHNEEVLHRRSNRTDIRICINAAPVRDREHNIVAAVATFHDVTELRDALRQQSILIDEVNHRVKNTMATVQSMALLTRSGATSIDDYVIRFEKRLLALSRAYNLMTANNWQGADLCEIVATTVAPYNTGNQVTVQGPSFKLPSNHTLALAAALQELVTNAAKYGSLSTQAGKLHIRWETQADRLVLNWQESSGPTVSPPTRRGFGTKLIQEVLARETDWTVEMEYLPGGLVCRLSIALR